MPEYNKRLNLVNFRLTDEEYEKLKHASSACGAHSLSDFVRGAILRAVRSSADGQSHPAANGSALEVRITDLQSTIRHLTGLLEEIGGAFAREARRQSETREVNNVSAS